MIPIKGDTFFIVEYHTGAGIDFKIAKDKDEVKSIVKQVIGKSEDDIVSDILEVEVTRKYKYVFDIVEDNSKTLEWKDIPPDNDYDLKP